MKKYVVEKKIELDLNYLECCLNYRLSKIVGYTVIGMLNYIDGQCGPSNVVGFNTRDSFAAYMVLIVIFVTLMVLIYFLF